ncbi:DUF2267 domain-containing protein [Marinactinospora thermotolerans]|uniref:Uncharacterized conserved protein, DUF2267 family n=1 Tax=Marinactinospora thermotolerans DSM 45154 TaxID=1122192 RepID=A0A1T4KB90_9ACTN|nr:DUF2267 domain-containing protein [Marinactinospora thermotolerans]SJZ39656.1 Uncharacterized conserved protein, DUF2267 family [Marinactinospora thermotolerans DSM 45154]
MQQHEFLARVRELGEYSDAGEAERVTRAVLGVLATRLRPDEVEDVAAQVPETLDEALREADGRGESFGVEEFCHRVAQATGARPRTAEWDASAVLTTLAEAVTGGQLNQILSQLPSGYAPLFGKPELAD